jgi:tetratricopeptide (TPR) repeat protein
VIDQRYTLHEPLGSGSMGIVYRATDRLTQRAVALKQVTAALNHLEFAAQRSTQSYGTSLNLALAQEFQTLAALHHPHIINVLDYGFDQDRPYFTMEFLPDAQTILQAGQSLPLAGRVRLLVQTLQALAYLHRHTILHRDLKPANILVFAGQVKVLDFGLSVTREQAQGVAGTLAYMAPEVLEGSRAGEMSDLYSLGVIAYELFAGHHPFAADNNQDLIRSIMTAEPDLHALHFDAAPDRRLLPILQRLLHKDPTARYQNPQQVIDEFSAALDQPALAQETIAIRESYLQAAPFIGRAAEMAQLSTALDTALTGHGSAWLIGGESGLGKSRMLDELRGPALVKGALVLYGQAIESGGPPYHLWRAPLRRLVVSTPLSDLDASVIKEIVPDIERLLGRSVPDAPRLDSRSAQQRLSLTLIKIFQSQAQPVVLLLDDLQWARENLLPLRELVQRTAGLPLLIVGNYRDDERPDIPAELPGVQVITLQRFTRDEIAALSAAMLGPGGAQPRIVDFLERETEGNAFFMVETVRALAEKVPQLDDVAEMPLPEHIFAKGVLAIAQQRLERLPLDYHPLLRTAAVAGRQIDVKILHHIDRTVNLDVWLLVCADAGILKFEEGQWIFAHNKLRDGILYGLAEDQPPKLHRLVAEAIEAVYPDDETYAVALLAHWRAAGELVKEIHYARRAGQQLLAASSYPDALDFLRHAIQMAQECAPDRAAEIQSETLDLEIQLGETLYSVGDYDAARKTLEVVLPAARQHGAQVSIATATRLLGSVIQVLGDYQEARRLMRESLLVSESTGDQQGVASALRSLGLIAENLGDMAEAINCYQRALVLFQTSGDRLGMAGTLANLGSIAGLNGLYAEAWQLYQESLSLFKAIGFRWGIAYTLIRLGDAVFHTGAYAEALRPLEEALSICREIGHRWGIAFALTKLGDVAYAMGHTNHAGGYFYHALRISHEMKLLPTTLDALVGVAMFLHADDQSDRAAELLGLVLNNPASDAETRNRAETFMRDYLSPALTLDRLASAINRGHTLDLATVVPFLLDEAAQSFGME